MSLLQYLGLVMVLAPFAAITVYLIIDLGGGATLAIWGMTAAFCAAIGGGIALMATG